MHHGGRCAAAHGLNSKTLGSPPFPAGCLLLEQAYSKQHLLPACLDHEYGTILRGKKCGKTSADNCGNIWSHASLAVMYLCIIGGKSYWYAQILTSQVWQIANTTTILYFSARHVLFSVTLKSFFMRESTLCVFYFNFWCSMMCFDQ